jgi:flagellar motility protein MotE (MotC chaperone)
MKRFRSPLFALVIGTLAGTAAGLGAFWQSAQVLVAQAREAQAAHAQRGRPEKPWDFWTLEIDNLASELRAQRAALDQRQEALRQQEARLGAEAAELAQLRLELEALRTTITTRIVQIQQDEEKNLKNLALTYSALSPRAALAILNQLDEQTTVKILFLMKPEVTAALFEQMGQAALNDPATARRAAVLSDRLRLLRPAGRIATEQ